MPQINAYLIFDGNCSEAMRFYQRTLGGTMEKLLTMGESPVCGQMPPGSENRIMHACLMLDGGTLMASDSMPGQPYEGMHGISLALAYSSVAEAQRAFDGLAEGGKVGMAMQPSFWSESFGMLTDRYGVSWMVNGPMKAF